MAASIPKSRSALRKLLGMLSTLVILCSRTAGKTEQCRLFSKSCSSADGRWVKQDSCRQTGFVSPWRLHGVGLSVWALVAGVPWDRERCCPKPGPGSSGTVPGVTEVTLLRYFGQQVQDRGSGPFFIKMDLPDNHQFKPVPGAQERQFRLTSAVCKVPSKQKVQQWCLIQHGCKSFLQM